MTEQEDKPRPSMRSWEIWVLSILYTVFMIAFGIVLLREFGLVPS